MRTFSLESVLMITTLIAVCLGLGAMEPAYGVLLAIFSLPALVRTVGIRARRKIAGRSMSLVQKSVTFLASMVLVVVIVFATVTTFFTICNAALEIPLLNSNIGAVLGFIVCLSASLGVAVFLVRAFWHRDF